MGPGLFAYNFDPHTTLAEQVHQKFSRFFTVGLLPSLLDDTRPHNVPHHPPSPLCPPGQRKSPDLPTPARFFSPASGLSLFLLFVFPLCFCEAFFRFYAFAGPPGQYSLVRRPLTTSLVTVGFSFQFPGRLFESSLHHGSVITSPPPSPDL